MDQITLKKRIRILLALFILALTVSGLTAIPLQLETGILERIFGTGTAIGEALLLLADWIDRVCEGVLAAGHDYPFLLYGTDWLAFVHVTIAIAFVGPLRVPRRNIWVIEFGMIACALVVPWAFAFGSLRDIPMFWRLIDCSFGIFGFVPLWWARKYTLLLLR